MAHPRSMAHLRVRHSERNLVKLLKYSPLVGIVGHRQVGKTTISGILGKEYYTLDLRTTFDAVERDPTGFLDSVREHPGILDECQHLPALFPALKEYVRRNPRPGSFILTGSVRFTSRRAIRESLTGRIITTELFPMDVAEIKGLPLPGSLLQLAKNVGQGKTFKDFPRFSSKVVPEYLEKGGLPGIFSVRDRVIREQKIATQLETILDRDLKLIIDTTLSFSTLRNALQFIAQHQGERFKLMDMARATRITRPTLAKIIRAFEGLFLIRGVRCEGGVGGCVYFLEDQAEASFLMGRRTDPLLDLTRFLYANLRTQIHYRPEISGEIFRFETRGGAVVPLCFRIDRICLGVIPIAEPNPNRSAISSARSFLKKHPGSGGVIFANEGAKYEIISSEMAIVPVSRLVLN